MVILTDKKKLSAGEAFITKGTTTQRYSEMTQEHQLLLLLARCHLTESDQREINALFQSEVDWTKLVTLAESHHVTSLLCHHLTTGQRAHVPDAIADAARIRLQRTREHNESMAAELIDLFDVMKKHGIDAVPFKGPVLAMQAYGDLGLRRFVDLDFLIRPCDFPGVRDILKDRGHDIERTFSPAREAAFIRYAGEDIFPHAGDRPPVEPHWEFAPGTLAVHLDYPALWKRTSDVALLDRHLPCWGPEDTVLILSIHGSKSLWTHLSYLCDVTELIRGTPDFSWETLWDRSRNQGCLRMVSIALLLAHNVLDLSLPDSVLTRLQDDQTSQDLAEHVERQFLFSDYEERTIYTIHRFHFDMRERMSDRLRYIYRTITTPRVQHFDMVDLPDSLFFLYSPIKLIHDYVLLPIWVLAKKMGIVRSR